jgi:hypothetical protein
MKRLSGTAYTLIAIMVIMPLFIAFSMPLSYFASKMLPVLFSSLVFVIAAIALVRDIRKTRRQSAIASQGTTVGAETGTADKFQDYLPFAAWVIAFSLGIYLVGFTISMVLFTGAYMKQHGSSWWGAITTAVIFAAIIYVVFDVLLQSDLYGGLIPMKMDIKF